MGDPPKFYGILEASRRLLTGAHAVNPFSMYGSAQRSPRASLFALLRVAIWREHDSIQAGRSPVIFITGECDPTGSLIHRAARRGNGSSLQVHPHVRCSESASSAIHHWQVCFRARGKVSSPLTRSWPRREKGFVHRDILALARSASPSDDWTAGNQMRDGGDMDDNAAAVGNGFFFLPFFLVPLTVYSVRLERSFCASSQCALQLLLLAWVTVTWDLGKLPFLFVSLPFSPSIWFCFRRKIILSGFAFRFVERW